MNWPRPWLRSAKPKIVSTYFGQAGSFAWDEAGNFVVVQGHGWLPTPKLQHGIQNIAKRLMVEMADRYFAAYVAVLNSLPFSLLLAEHCPHVAGGQFNLAKRFVDPIPLPNLPELSLQIDKGIIIRELEHAGRIQAGGELAPAMRVNELVGTLYGVPFNQWPQQAL